MRPDGTDVPPDRDAMITRIESVQFGTTRFAAGYDEKQVDDFLDQIVAALRQREQPTQILSAVAFSVTRLRPGYSMRHVDALIDEIRQWVNGAGD